MNEQVRESTDHRKPLLALAGIIFLLLIPFVNKAYHIDDPFYLWTGQHILEDPFDFYGYDINWTGFNSSAAAENKNPPLVSYYMALIGLLVGWQEWTMHLAFILPAIGVGLGSYLIATRFTERPLLSIVIAISTPAFVVSSTNLMAEIVMLCFYVWAIHFWMLGIESKKNRYLFVGALCIAASTLAKYFGFSLLPLLFVYTILETRKAGWWLAYLGIAIGIILLYEAWTLHLYDQGLLSEAAAFATDYRQDNAISRNTKSFVGLAFTGGCIAGVTLLSPVLFSWKWHLPIWASAAYFFFIAYNYPHIFQEQHILKRDYNDWNFIVHFSIFCVAGLFVILLPILDLLKHRNKQSLFLFLWVMGTFLFATQVNWTANARSIVPMATPIGILVGRRLSLVHADKPFPLRRVSAGLAIAFMLALTLAYADYTLARAGKQAAAALTEKFPDKDSTIRFTGHWGYQYYMMQTQYFQPLVYNPTLFKEGDILIISENNTGLFLEDGQGDFPDPMTIDVFPWATVWSKSKRSGLYADIWGSIPYSFGSIPDETFHIMLSYRDTMIDLKEFKPE